MMYYDFEYCECDKCKKRQMDLLAEETRLDYYLDEVRYGKSEE